MNQAHDEFRQALLDVLPRLRKYCYALTNDLHNSEDLLQASVQRALEKWQQYQADTHFDRWMYRLCRNLWIDTMRKDKPSEELDPEIETDNRVLEDTLVNENLLAQVKEKMSELSEGLRIVLYLVAVEGRSYQETAEFLDIPKGTVMSRLARARQQLSQHGFTQG
ncbi:RNA polymerase sigma factor [Bermanella marisrubri]|uniref:Putative rna polymerase sigma-e factor (Sigma-24) protein n=1 Tax=Bermanella marisrubri TaxID=207949 RepID=Q1N4A3_9GAMM|nr:RNA polymerase sigma factor [Bermanella marisrubri]EAT12962.1 putative rna polymerase sigma-e factor (sigma-24) protein [Oceanobacter sp. RED65] [Bermanella marisrubri]QIZ82910.1 RNA polymerase sigma factor [Bermanella marisrubri]